MDLPEEIAKKDIELSSIDGRKPYVGLQNMECRFPTSTKDSYW